MEPLVHLIIPLLIIIAFKPTLDKKLVFGLAILAVLPDFDFIISHRSLFHNVFFVLFFSFVIYLLFKFVVNKDDLKKERENKNAFYLSIFYFFSHLLLDIGNPGVPFFYPLSNKLFTVNFMLLTSSMGGIFNGVNLSTKYSVVLNPLIEGTSVVDGPVLTTFGLILLVFVTVLLTTKFINKER